MSRKASQTEETLHASQSTPDSTVQKHDEEPSETTVVDKPPVPPNGGFKAWFRTFGAWLMYIASWGPPLTFGDFSEYYASPDGPLASKALSDIAWIGSLSTLLLITSGVITGPLFDRGYLKPLMFVGTILLVVGIMMTSLCKEYYQFILAQGVCVGLGSGLLYIPATAFVSTSFTTKRPIAVGLTTTGASVGGIIFPTIFRRLLPQIGFGWTVRVIGFIVLALACAGFLILLDAPVIKNKPRNLIDWNALREVPFIFVNFMFFCHFLSFWIPLFFIPSFSTYALGASNELGSYMLVIANAGTFFGRLIPAVIAQRIGAANTVYGLTLIVAMVTFCWIAVRSIGGMVVWSLFWGLGAGGFSSIDPVVVTHPVLSPSTSVIGTRLGMAYFCAGIGMLIGTPIASALGGGQGKSYVNAQIFAGAILIGAFLFATVPWWFILQADKAKWKSEKEKGEGTKA